MTDMMRMMDDPVVAMALLVALVTVLAALTVGLRVLGGLDGRYRPHAPARKTSRTAARARQATALRTAEDRAAVAGERSPEQ